MSLALTKYVGSKLGLLAVHPGLFPTPDHGCPVAVPFVGGGSLAAHYGARGIRVIASDINARAINTHSCVRGAPEIVIEQLEDIARDWRKAVEPLGGDERDAAGRVFFEEQRGKLNDPRGDGDSYTLAARFLFIVRAGFNGLYRENAIGDCTTAYGKPGPRADLVQADKLRAYADAVQGVEFLCEDFAVTCARARSGWAVVCDAPYEGTFTGYCGGDWSAKQPGLPGLSAMNDRERLAAMLVYLDAIGARWTNHDADTPTTRSLYAKWPVVEVSRKGNVNSDAEDRGNVTELLWRNWR